MHANNRHVILKSLDLNKYNWFMDVNNNSNSIVFPAAFTLLPHKFGLRCAAGMNHLPAEKSEDSIADCTISRIPRICQQRPRKTQETAGKSRVGG